MITRKYPESEITRDPIYLLQSRQIVMIGEPKDAEWDGENWVKGDSESEDFQILSEDDLIAQECAAVRWETESVWFTRDEAEAWGADHSYRFGEGRKGIDWRVYCLCAEGELAQILKEHTER